MTTETSPIRKLYKRCKKQRHADCPGSFGSHSICECACHALEASQAVEEAQAIVTAPTPKRTSPKGFAAKRAAAAAAFVPEPDGTYVNHPVRHEADYGLRGVKNKHAYGFFDPCDEHATEENATIIAYGRSDMGAAKQVAANCIERTLRGCDTCRERTRQKLADFAVTQGDAEFPYTYKYPKRSRPTRMSREAFIAKYADRRTVIAGDRTTGEITSVIFRCANRDCMALKATDPRDTVGIVLHDTDKLCTTCELNGVKLRKRRAA